MCKICCDPFWLSMPRQCHANCIEYNAQEDKVIKEWIHGDTIASILNSISSVYELDQRLCFVAVNNVLAPVHFGLCEQVVHFQSLLFLCEYVNNDTHEHIEDEQMKEEYDDNEEND